MAEPIRVVVDGELAPLVPAFLDNRRGDVGRLRAALATHDAAALHVLGHNLRGAGGAYGFPQVSALGAAIESAAEAGDLAAVARCADELEAFLARVQVGFSAGGA